MKAKKEHNFKFFEENFVEIITIFKDQDHIFYLLFFLSIVFSFCYYISNVYILYHYSPLLNILFEIILPLDSDILDYIFFGEESDHRVNKILERLGYQMIGYAFLIFGALIISEVIVLNFLGLNKNIEERRANDSLALLNINNENDNVNEGQLYHNQESEEY